MKNFQKVYHGKMEYQKEKSKWNKRSLQYNGQKASEIMADNKLQYSEYPENTTQN